MRLLILLLPTQLAYHFWPEWSHIFGIRIDYLSPAIYLTDLIIVYILASNVKTILNRKRIKLLALLGILAFVNIFVSQIPELSFYKWLKFFEFLLLGIYIYDNQSIKKSLTTPLSVSIIITFFIAIIQIIKQASVGGIFYWLGERSFLSTTPGIALFEVFGKQYMRPYATFPHPNALAGFALVAAILISRHGYSRLHKLALLFAITLVVLSWSQSAWLVAVVVLALHKFHNRLNNSATITLGVLTISFSLLLPILSRFITLDLPENIYVRQELSLAAGRMISMKPFFGVGLGNFIPSLASRVWLQPVHNIFLLVAAEVGLLGLVLLTLLIIKNLRLESLALIAIILTGFLDHYWVTLQQTQILFVIILSLSFASINYGNKNS